MYILKFQKMADSKYINGVIDEISVKQYLE